MKRKPKPKTIELVKKTYNPTKAELEEGFKLDVPGDTVLEKMKNLTGAVTRPVKVRGLDRPRTRR